MFEIILEKNGKHKRIQEEDRKKTNILLLRAVALGYNVISCKEVN